MHVRPFRMILMGQQSLLRIVPLIPQPEPPQVEHSGGQQASLVSNPASQEGSGSLRLNLWSGLSVVILHGALTVRQLRGPREMDPGQQLEPIAAPLIPHPAPPHVSQAVGQQEISSLARIPFAQVASCACAVRTRAARVRRRNFILSQSVRRQDARRPVVKEAMWRASDNPTHTPGGRGCGIYTTHQQFVKLVQCPDQSLSRSVRFLVTSRRHGSPAPGSILLEHQP